MVGGSQLYTYQLGSYDTSSVALSGSNILVATAAGELYDFVPAGGNDATLPSAAITYPGSGTMLANPNGNLTISGTASDPKGVAAVEVSVQSNGTGGPWWDGATGTWSPGAVDTPAQLASPGATSTSWTLSYPVPRAGATYAITAYGRSVSGQSGLTPSSVQFAVNYSTVGPYVAVSSPDVAPGGSFTVSGGGFADKEKVEIRVYGSTIATIRTDSKGLLPSTSVKLPKDAAFGETSVTATGRTSHRSASVAIVVTNNWAQFGDNAARTGYEPNDLLPNSYIFPGDGQWIDVAWHFDDDGVAMNASPAIVDGVVYTADTAGQLFALDAYNGGLLWTFTLASGAPIDGSPAVDPGLGLVIFGANDGTVDAVSLATGGLVWSSTVGGDVRAPDLYGNTVYVTTSTGTVAELSAANGSSVWSVTEPSGIGGAPSLAGSLLVVGETNGDILGVNAANGSTEWKYATSGAIESAALISGGWVYVGSMNGNLYSLDQSTGKLHWSYSTGGGIAVTPSLDNSGYLSVGSNNGNFYLLKATNGYLHFSDSLGSPVVGISCVDGVEVIETANGHLHAEKTYLHGGGWNFVTGAGLVTTPVILDGDVYVAAGDGNLYAFTPTGAPPPI
jgi:outer membrane protein assembly factor BamB